jgi:hypothetical protein
MSSTTNFEGQSRFEISMIVREFRTWRRFGTAHPHFGCAHNRQSTVDIWLKIDQNDFSVSGVFVTVECRHREADQNEYYERQNGDEIEQV